MGHQQWKGFPQCMGYNSTDTNKKSVNRMDLVQLLPYTSAAVQCAVVPNLHYAVRCFATSHQQSQSSVNCFTSVLSRRQHQSLNTCVKILFGQLHFLGTMPHASLWNCIIISIASFILRMK